MRSSIRWSQALHKSARWKDEGNDVKLKHRRFKLNRTETPFPREASKAVLPNTGCSEWFYSPHLQKCSISDGIKPSAPWCDRTATVCFEQRSLPMPVTL